MSRAWILTFPAPDRMLSVNGGKHWSVVSGVRRTWRETTFQYAKAAKLPKGLTRVRIDIEMRFPTLSSRRDEQNYSTTVGKPCVDAIAGMRVYRNPKTGAWVHEVGYGLIADDQPKKYLHCRDCPHMFISNERGPKPYGAVTVTITDLSGEVAHGAEV